MMEILHVLTNLSKTTIIKRSGAKSVMTTFSNVSVLLINQGLEPLEGSIRAILFSHAIKGTMFLAFHTIVNSSHRKTIILPATIARKSIKRSKRRKLSMTRISETSSSLKSNKNSLLKPNKSKILGNKISITH